MALSTRRTIAAPVETAFDLMADARNEASWNGQVSRSELVSGEPVGEGTSFLTVNRGQPYDAVITTYRRPEVLVFEVTGRQMDITAAFRFQAGAGDCTLDGSFDFRPKGAFRFVFPLMRPMVRRDLDRQSTSFAAFAASRAGDAPASTA